MSVSLRTPIEQTGEAAAPRSRSLVMLTSVDPLLLGAAVGLAVFSVITLRGAGDPGSADKQMLYAAVGLVAALIITRFDYSRLREFRYVFYGAAIVLNIVVFAFSGTAANAQAHATRWIPLPFFQLQPSEFGKILLIVSIAAFAVDRTRRMTERQTLVRVILLALVPAVIVMQEPDLGTGLVYLVIAAAVVFFAGIGWKYLAGLAGLVVVAAVIVTLAAPALGVHPLSGYQQQRLTTFLSQPTACHHNPTCFQLYQGEIAIGSGGKTGSGAAGATQTKFHFVPEANTDFIFAVVGETYGFAGAALVLSLYALLIWRTLRIVAMAKNLFGTLVASGILGMLMFQVFLNIGMTLGIMPVTGVPLPLLSYGGSSVVATFLAIGLLESIHVHSRLASAGKARVLLV